MRLIALLLGCVAWLILTAISKISVLTYIIGIAFVMRICVQVLGFGTFAFPPTIIASFCIWLGTPLLIRLSQNKQLAYAALRVGPIMALFIYGVT